MVDQADEKRDNHAPNWKILFLSVDEAQKADKLLTEHRIFHSKPRIDGMADEPKSTGQEPT